MAVQNASIQTQDTTPKSERRGDTRNAQRVVVDPESREPESYRGPIRNVERIFAPVNDNQKGGQRPGLKKGPAPTPGRGARVPNVATLPTGGQTKSIVEKGAAVLKAGSATWFIIGTTWIFYMVQFIFAVLYLMVMAGLMSYEDSWAETFDIFGWGGDAGAGMFLLCLGVILAMWLCTFLTALMIFFLRGVNTTRGISVVIALGSMVFSAIPVANLAPLVWVWCAYVVKTQKDD